MSSSSKKTTTPPPPPPIPPPSTSNPAVRPPKGHRQKGAGTTVVGKTEVKRHGLDIKEWQQTPKQLLENWAKNLKRPKPRFDKLHSSKGFLVRCVLMDGKNSDKDIIVLPTTAFDDEVEAEHGVALLALAKVDSQRQHEMKLPEPYRTVWLKLVGREKKPNSSNDMDKMGADGDDDDNEQFKCEKCGKTFDKSHSLQTHMKNVHPKPKVPQPPPPQAAGDMTDDNSTQTVSTAAVDVVPVPEESPPPPPEPEKKPSESLLNMKNALKFASEQERRSADLEAERIRAQQRKREEAQERQELEDSAGVFMSEDNRVAIEAIIKLAQASSSSHHTSTPTTISSNDAAVLENVLKMGFCESDAKLGVSQGGGTLEGALDWLCLHLDEERLPEGFDPRGLQMEVVRPKSSAPLPSDSITTSQTPQQPQQQQPDFTITDDTSIISFFTQSFPGTTIPPVPFSDCDDTQGEWEALEAIVGSSDAIKSTSLHSLFRTYRLQLGLSCPLNPPSHAQQPYLDILLPAGYPQCPALCVMWCSPQDHAMGSTRLLNRKSAELIPELSAFTLWDYARTLTKNEVAFEALASLSGNNAPMSSMQSSRHQKQQQQPFRLTDTERVTQSTKLAQAFQTASQLPATIAMQGRRARLPAAAHANHIIETVKTHQVVLIRGETGCGKTTQVPQYLLEHEIKQGRGGFISIVCTQPRRLAAVSVATRVAEEMSQPLGGLVGYSVQLDSKKDAKQTRLEFVTTGLLLRRLQSDPLLQHVTHVLVDEVHERSVDSDFLLACLKTLLVKRPDLKLVLMSATMDESAFTQYFDPTPPVLRIPGFTHSVAIEYLEDAMHVTGYMPNGTQNLDFERRVKVVAERAVVDYDLLASVVLRATAMLDDTEQDDDNDMPFRASVLVFVSGVAEISKATQAISQRAGKGKLNVLPLHGALTNADQRRVFENVTRLSQPRKIIVSTNVTETSITIDDVVYVIDTGRVKEVRYDSETKMTSLVDTWISFASARQRAGRAGRVRPGFCIRLWSKHLALEEQQLPEIHRVPLEQCALQVAASKLGKIATFLGSLVDPPRQESVHAAVTELLDIGALEEPEAAANVAEVLTPLGRHLSELPIDARLGKMLLYGCILGVGRDALTIAAFLSRTRSPFMNPMPEQRAEAEKARKSLAELGVAGGAQSDHLLMVQAFEAWNALENERDRRDFAVRHFLSHEGLREVAALRKEYAGSLEKIGFNNDNRGGGRNNMPDDDPALRKRRQLIKAALIAGLYPKLCRIRKPPTKFVEMSGGALAKVAEAHELKFFDETIRQRVFVHPSSINFGQNQFKSPWLVYTEKFETSKVFLRDTTCVAPFGVLLFGGKLQVLHGDGLIVVGDFASFRAPARVGVLIKELRILLRKMLDEKLENPSLQFEHEPVVEAVKRLIEGDGFL